MVPHVSLETDMMEPSQVLMTRRPAVMTSPLNPTGLFAAKAEAVQPNCNRSSADEHLIPIAGKTGVSCSSSRPKDSSIAPNLCWHCAFVRKLSAFV